MSIPHPSLRTYGVHLRKSFFPIETTNTTFEKEKFKQNLTEHFEVCKNNFSINAGFFQYIKDVLEHAPHNHGLELELKMVVKTR